MQNLIKHLLSKIMGGITPEEEESEKYKLEQQLKNKKQCEENILELEKNLEDRKILKNKKNILEKENKKSSNQLIKDIIEKLEKLGEYDDSLGVNIKANPFRLNAKHILLTYSMNNNLLSTSKPEDFYSFIDKIFQHNLHWTIMAFEESEITGYKHVHIYVNIHKRCNFKNPRCLDINGIHGKYETVKDVPSIISYITKTEKHFMFSGKCNKGINQLTQRQLTSIVVKELGTYFTKHCKMGTHAIREKIFKILNANIDVRSYKHQILNTFKNYIDNKYVSTKDWILFFDSISHIKDIDNFSALQLNPTVKNQTMFIHKKFLIVLYIWLEMNNNKFNKPISFGLQGPTGTYKTTVLNHLGGDSILTIQHSDILKTYTKEQHRIIFYDDIIAKGKTREEIIHLLDSEQNYQANVKNSMVVVDKSTVRMITTNNDFKDLFDSKDKAIARRIMKVKLIDEDKIYKDDLHFLDNYSDVFDGILLYIKSRISWYYNVYINIFKDSIISIEQKEKRNYIKIDYGSLNLWLGDSYSLKRSICGNLNYSNDNEFDVAIAIYKCQILNRNKIIQIDQMLEIIKIVKQPMCQCEARQDGNDIVCIVHRYFLRYIKSSDRHMIPFTTYVKKT